ncbi:MAG: response regulator [Bacteroidota bacterium]
MKKTILVVDDFAGIREIVKKTLDRKDYNTLLASNAEEALRFFDGRHIHLLITDYEMPGLNGPDLIREVRNLGGYDFMPVIILSASPPTGKEDELQELNVTTWIQKPFDIRSFYSIVERYLKR